MYVCSIIKKSTLYYNIYNFCHEKIEILHSVHIENFGIVNFYLFRDGNSSHD